MKLSLMASIGFLDTFIAVFSFLLLCYLLSKKPFDSSAIKKHFQSNVLWNWPVLGMFPGLLVRMHRIENSFEILENSDLTFRFKGMWFFGSDNLITADPANVHHIVTSKLSNYIRGPKFKEIYNIFGNGVINSDSERGSNLRKCHQALLHRQDFQRFSMNTTISKLKNVLIPLLNHYAEEGTVLDLQNVFQRFTFDTTLITTTGSDPQSLSIDMPNLEFVKAFEDIKETIFYRHRKPRFLWKLQRLMRLGQEKKMMEADEAIDRLCSQYIEAKKAKTQQEVDTHEAEDALTFFIKLDKIKYKVLDPNDDKFLKEIILGFILAGSDTVASALSWFFLTISQNPNVLIKIRNEIDIKLPRTGNVQENLGKLVYLHGALWESLRLYPPVPFQLKNSIEQDVLPSGHKVEPNLTVMMFVYGMGRMRAVWGEDASEYKPERWISETGELRHEPSYKFFAFNSGPRTCLGKQIAMIQMKTVVVEILQKYDVNVVEEQKSEPDLGFILYIKDGLKVTLSKR